MTANNGSGDTAHVDTPDGSGDPRDVSTPALVRLDVPAEVRFLRLVRLAASGLAGDCGFDVDAIEELRVTVDEACAALLADAPPDARLVVDLDVDGDAIAVSGRCPVLAAPTLHPVAAEIVGLLAEEFALDADDGVGRFRLRMRPHAAAV